MIGNSYPQVKVADANAKIMMAELLLACDPYTIKVGVDCTKHACLHSKLFGEDAMKAGGGDFFNITALYA